MLDEIEATDASAQCPRCGSFVYSDGLCPGCSDEFDFTGDDGAVPGEETASDSAQPQQYGTCLFTDLVESTALKQRLGDLAETRLSGKHDEIFRELLRACGGHEQINPGDGFLATFERPSDAVRFALAFRERLSALDGPEALEARIGIHAGGFHVVPAATEAPAAIFGLAVDIAARVMGLALPQQILMTKNVFDDARQAECGDGKFTEVRWMAHGAYWLKGVDEPVELYEVGWPESSPLQAPPDSTKGRRQIIGDREDAPGWRPAVGLEVPDRPGWMLERRLGEGGFGEVWLTVKTPDRERAFKFCFRPDRVRALRREVTVFRWLRDQLGERGDIASLLDWHLDEPPYFLESGFAPGGNLVDWARNEGGLEAIDLKTRLEIAIQTARAIQAAHTVGVLHKDIKPSNVLVAKELTGAVRVRITDFGLGDILHRDHLEDRGISVMGLTRERRSSGQTTVTGTAGYMAPEVRSGNPATMRSDVFSLGVLLYQLIVGDFKRFPAEGWVDDVHDPLLQDDIRSCIFGDPERRLSSASELVHRLESITERRERGAAEQHLLEEVGQAKQRRARQRQQTAVALLMTALTGVLLLGLQFYSARRELALTNLTISRLVSQNLQRTILNATSLVEFGAINPRLQRALASMAELSGGATPEGKSSILEAPSRPLLQEELSDIVGSALRADWIASAAVANLNGAMVGHLVSGERGLVPDDDVLGGDFSNRDWFRGMKQRGQPAAEGAARYIIGDTHISEPYVAQTSGNEPKIAVSRPIFVGSMDRPIGVIQVALAIEYLHQWLRNAAKSGDDGGIERDIVVVNRAGQVVLHPNRSAVLKSQDPTSKEAPEWKAAAALPPGVTRELLDPFQHRRFDVSVSRLDVADESFTVLVRSPPSSYSTTLIVLAVIFALQLAWAGFLWISGYSWINSADRETLGSG